VVIVPHLAQWVVQVVQAQNLTSQAQACFMHLVEHHALMAVEQAHQVQSAQVVVVWQVLVPAQAQMALQPQLTQVVVVEVVDLTPQVDQAVRQDQVDQVL